MQLSLKDDILTLTFEPTPQDLQRVRALPGRTFNPTTGDWQVPYTKTTHAMLRTLGFSVAHLPEPVRNGYDIGVDAKLLTVRVPWSPVNQQACRLIPDHRAWNAQTRAWHCKPSARNMVYLKKAFPQAVWTAAALDLYASKVTRTATEATALQTQKEALATDLAARPVDYKHGGPAPRDHQRKAFLLSRDAAAFALLMEQRTGKSKVIIDTAAWLHLQGKIDAVLIFAPNGVKTNWVTEELPIHMPSYIAWKAAYWSAGGKAKVRRQWADVFALPQDWTLKFLVVNIEAMSGGKLAPLLEGYCKRHKVLMVVDESTRIKAPAAKRTRRVIALRRWAPYRRILSGMPVAKGPLDIFAPFVFLDPDILGFGSFYAFRNHFAIMGGWNGKEIVDYCNLDELQKLIAGHSYRVIRDDCMDLPKKQYQKLTVDLSPLQQKYYDQMRDEMLVEYGEETIVSPIVITQMLRLQQITGGFLPYAGEHLAARDRVVIPIDGPNAKLEALLDVLAEETRKVIVWAAYRPEIAIIADALRREYGAPAVVEFHGGVNDEGKLRARQAFQDPKSPVRFFVGQPASGGIGITLTQAKTVVYFSNTFNFEDRKQSEDRAEGLGQTESVTIIDIVAHDTVDDKKILPSLRAKQSVANQVTGDRVKDWI